MADNVPITAGSGTTIATDDVSGVHYQINKLALGAADAATLASSNSGVVDGGTQRVVLPTDQPPVSVDNDALVVSGSVTSATNIFSQDCSQYSYVSVHITSAGTSSTVTYEGSNDNTNWISAFGQNLATTVGVLVNTTTSTTIIVLPTPFRYFRARVSTYGSGTVAATAIFKMTGIDQRFNGTVSSSGNFAVTMAASSTGSPAKSRDNAAGATDTGIPAFFVRRDTPTAVTPAAGDYEAPQIDQHGSVWVREKTSTTSALTNVAGSATSVTVLALNANRKGATIYNDSTAILYLKLGATASTTSFTVKMQPDSYFEVPGQYTGVIDGIWASATGSARVTELSS